QRDARSESGRVWPGMGPRGRWAARDRAHPERRFHEDDGGQEAAVARSREIAGRITGTWRGLLLHYARPASPVKERLRAVAGCPPGDGARGSAFHAPGAFRASACGRVRPLRNATLSVI